MSSIQIFVGKKNDIPVQYLEQYFALQQLHEEDFFGFLPPSLDYYRNNWTVPREKGSDWINAIVVNEKDLVIGFGIAIWSTMYENLDRAFFRLYITPKERRKGIGTQLLKEMVSSLPPIIETLYSDAPTATPGEYFLQNFKKESSYTEEIIVVDLEIIDIHEVEKEANEQKQQALNKGYDIVRIDNCSFGESFDEEEFVGIVEQIWNDMPIEDLAEEDFNMTVERYNAICDRNKRKGLEYVSFVAVHLETQKPVGYTTYAVNKYQPAISWQDDTGIIQEHRGNGLGLAIKYQSLLTLLKETKAKYWRTSSSRVNKHMRKINEKLGHKLWQIEPVYEFERKIIEDIVL